MPKAQRDAKDRASGEEHNYLDFAETQFAQLTNEVWPDHDELTCCLPCLLL